MDHGIAHLDTGRVTVEQHSADLHFQRAEQLTKDSEVIVVGQQRGRELAAQGSDGAQ
ncbi:hypothetical protein D3C78_1353540 [compost metagenome]